METSKRNHSEHSNTLATMNNLTFTWKGMYCTLPSGNRSDIHWYCPNFECCLKIPQATMLTPEDTTFSPK